MFYKIWPPVSHRLGHRVGHRVGHGLHHGLGHVAYPTFCPHPLWRQFIKSFYDSGNSEVQHWKYFLFSSAINHGFDYGQSTLEQGGSFEMDWNLPIEKHGPSFLVIWQSFTCRILLFQMQWEDLVSRHFWDMKKVSITGAGHLWEWSSYAVTRVVRCTCIWQLMGACSANDENEKNITIWNNFFIIALLLLYTQITAVPCDIQILTAVLTAIPCDIQYMGVPFGCLITRA